MDAKLQRRIQRAVLAIVQYTPRFDLGVVKDRISVDAELTKDGLMLRRDLHGINSI